MSDVGEIRSIMNLLENFDFDQMTYSLRKDAFRAISRRGLNPDEYEVVPSDGGRFKIIPKAPATSSSEVRQEIQQIENIPETPDIRSLLDRLEALEAKLAAQESKHQEHSSFHSHNYLHPGIAAISRYLRKHIHNGLVDNHLKLVINPKKNEWLPNEYEHVSIGTHYTKKGPGFKEGMFSVYITDPISITIYQNKTWQGKLLGVTLLIETFYLKDGYKAEKERLSFNSPVDKFVKPIGDQLKIIDATGLIDLIIRFFIARFQHNSMNPDYHPFQE